MGPNTITKAISFAFPGSTLAKAQDHDATGCWYISMVVKNIEGSGQYVTYHDGRDFVVQDPMDPDFIQLYLESEGVMCPDFKKNGDPKILNAIHLASQDNGGRV